MTNLHELLEFLRVVSNPEVRNVLTSISEGQEIYDRLILKILELLELQVKT